MNNENSYTSEEITNGGIFVKDKACEIQGLTAPFCVTHNAAAPQTSPDKPVRAVPERIRVGALSAIYPTPPSIAA
jgi:hypothetical protein